MPYQLAILKGRSAAKALRIPADVVTTVGRQQGCQIRIGSAQVSRKHCELFESQGRLVVKDLDSSNGTFVDGQRVEGQQALEPGQTLSVGSIVFRVERVAAPVAAAAHGAPGRPSDTAVAQAVAARDDELDFEIEADSATDVETLSPAAHAERTKEVGEDAVVDFLLDLDVEDHDKR
jgi:hypothetical protein